MSELTHEFIFLVERYDDIKNKMTFIEVITTTKSREELNNLIKKIK